MASPIIQTTAVEHRIGLRPIAAAQRAGNVWITLKLLACAADVNPAITRLSTAAAVPQIFNPAIPQEMKDIAPAEFVSHKWRTMR